MEKKGCETKKLNSLIFEKEMNKENYKDNNFVVKIVHLVLFIFYKS